MLFYWNINTQQNTSETTYNLNFYAQTKIINAVVCATDADNLFYKYGDSPF